MSFMTVTFTVGLNIALCVSLVPSTRIRQRADTEATLANAVRSNDLRALLTSCGTPIVLGYATFSSAHPLTIPHIKDHDALLINPFRFIYYHRHANSSLRFYATEVDASSLPPLSSEAKIPVEVSLAHDFTRRRDIELNIPEYQLIVNLWNIAKSLEEAVERSRAQSSKRNSSRSVDRKFERPQRHIASASLPKASGEYSFLSKLREFSFAVRQTEGRAMMLYQLSQRQHLQSDENVALSSLAYNRHYNSLWVILNDLIIGLAFRQFLCQNRDALNAMVADGLESTLAVRIQRVLLWLDSWPAGLKLNTELSRFYSHGFIGLITRWTKLLHYSLSLLPAISFVVETTSLLGMTMTLSLSLDLISVLTAHLQACYFISSTIYRHVLLLIGSLWNLFRGKRYNTLRNRTDPWDYDVDQLLLGTIVFTLAAHLFPTILVYYALFALVRLGIIVLYASCETLLAFMNHFPLFALMLRSKDPQRLPGDTYLHVNHTARGSTVTVESHPLPYAIVFAQYGGLWRRLARHYHPIRLGKRLLQGQMLDTFPQASTDPPLDCRGY
ncbi:Gpi1-domain-containing protein [Imleria badia]|nr:Gpi1-domain-containing protein [Imleria badia]